MKNKKNRKRLLLLLPVFAILLSLFAVGASAYHIDADPCCDSCNVDTGIDGERIQGKYGKVYCTSCGVVWGYVDYTEVDIRIDNETYSIYECYYSDYSGNYSASVSGYLGYNGNGEGEDYQFTLPVIAELPAPPAPETPAPDNSGMTGEMVGAITGAFGGILGGIGATIVEFFESTVIDDNGELTAFAKASLAFLGITFSLSIVYIVNKYVDRRG